MIFLSSEVFPEAFLPTIEYIKSILFEKNLEQIPHLA